MSFHHVHRKREKIEINTKGKTHIICDIIVIDKGNAMSKSRPITANFLTYHFKDAEFDFSD